MSMLFFDGFDRYANATDFDSESQFNPAKSSGFVPDALVRYGSGKSVKSALDSTLAYTFPADQVGKEIYVGFSVRFSSLSETAVLVLLSNSVTFNAGDSTEWQISLRAEVSTNKFVIHSGATNRIISSTTIALNTWYYVEVKLLVHGTTGSAELKINGVSEGTFVGDTQDQSNDSVLAMGIGSTFSSFDGSTYYLDDMYVLNNDGTTNNTFLGDVRCQLLAPNTDNTTAWTRSGGAANYEMVDEISASDEDTTYVSSITLAQSDEYGLPSMQPADSVHAVVVISDSAKDSAATRSVRIGITNGANAQSTDHALVTTYTQQYDIYETKDGSNPWTESDVNASVCTLETI